MHWNATWPSGPLGVFCRIPMPSNVATPLWPKPCGAHCGGSRCSSLHGAAGARKPPGLPQPWPAHHAEA
eukprot:4869715-Prorocentrum_lima.AAC.1